MNIISTGKYDNPIIRKSLSSSRYKEYAIHEYPYYFRILWRKYPITGKEYSVINNIIERICK